MLRPIDSYNTPPHFLGRRLRNFFRLYSPTNRVALFSLIPFRERRKLCFLETPSNKLFRYFVKYPSSLCISSFLTLLKSFVVSSIRLQETISLGDLTKFLSVEVKAIWSVLENVPTHRYQSACASYSAYQRDSYDKPNAIELNKNQKYNNRIFNYLS